MKKTSIREVVTNHPELLDADTFVIVSKRGDDISLSVAGTGKDVFDLVASAMDTIMDDFECPGCPSCQNGKTH